MGGGSQGQCDSGVYRAAANAPRTGCIGRLEHGVLPLRATYRSALADGIDVALNSARPWRQPLQLCAPRHLSGPDPPSIEDNVAINLSHRTAKWSVGAACRPASLEQRLQDRDASRHRQQCDGGPRHVDHRASPHRQRAAGDMGGAPARLNAAPTDAHGDRLPGTRI